MVDTYYYTDSNGDYDSLVTIKIFLALGIFFVSVASASAPLTVIRIDDHVFSLGNMFSAGILFAAGLVHQLPDSAERLNGALSHGHGHGLLDSMRDQSFGHEHPVHYHEEHLADHARGSLLSSVALLVALSLHSVLEAVAIGAASTRRTVVSTVSAVLAHKAFAGYALGSAMVAAHVKRWHVLVLGCVFGACSIVGVALGLLLERTVVRHANGNANTNGNGNGNASENEGVPIGIVQAVVAGTFLYVAIVEIAMKELLTHRGGGDLPVGDCQVRKLVAFWIGYLVMSVFALWV
eukprot:jgi/Psemu1/291735/fgenesh1_pg.795_\